MYMYCSLLKYVYCSVYCGLMSLWACSVGYYVMGFVFSSVNCVCIPIKNALGEIFSVVEWLYLGSKSISIQLMHNAQVIQHSVFITHVSVKVSLLYIRTYIVHAIWCQLTFYFWPLVIIRKSQADVPSVTENDEKVQYFQIPRYFGNKSFCLSSRQTDRQTD